MKTILVLLVLLLSAPVHAATVSFMDNSTNELGFLLQLIKAGNVIRWATLPANTGTGMVTNAPINDSLGILPGECVRISAFNQAGMSAQSNMACLTTTGGAAPSVPGATTVAP